MDIYETPTIRAVGCLDAEKTPFSVKELILTHLVGDIGLAKNYKLYEILIFVLWRKTGIYFFNVKHRFMECRLPLSEDLSDFPRR